jgi:protein-S-isoprenylcysteine O-methyltransferase Ste14
MMSLMEKYLDLPPIWLAGFLAVVWALGGIGAVFGWFGDVAGAALVGMGLALMGLAVQRMTQARTTVMPHRQASHLVTEGVFRFSRNPIYLGDVLILLGACLIWDAPLGIGLVPVFVLVIRARFILPEEATLAVAFGADFTAWAARVRRWL